MNIFENPSLFGYTYALIQGYSKCKGVNEAVAQAAILAMLHDNKDNIECQGIPYIEWLYVGQAKLKTSYPDLYAILKEKGSILIKNMKS